MRKYDFHRARTALLAALAALACGGGSKTPPKDDPNAPAVVQTPPVVLPSDTAKPDTMQAYREKVDSIKRLLLTEYAVLGAATVIGDAAMIGQYYADDAMARFGDTYLPGRMKIVNGWIAFVRRGGLKEIERRPGKLTGLGNTWVDSSIYTLRSKGPGGTLKEERGDFMAVWEYGGTPPHWSLHTDELKPPPGPKKKP